MVEPKVTMRIIDYEITGDHVDFKLVVKDETDTTYQILARYSRLREIHEALQKKLNKSQIPDFPPKTFLKNNTPAFLTQRQKGLENYFNVLLRKFPIEELAPLREFYKTGKIIGTGQPQKSETSKPKNEAETKTIQDKIPEKINNAENLDKIVDNYSGQFYDLKDTPAFPDEDFIKKKKKQYQTNVRIETGTFDVFKVPGGRESNLITVQDESLVCTETGIGNILDKVLDDLELDRKHIDFFANLDIVAKLD